MTELSLMSANAAGSSRAASTLPASWACGQIAAPMAALAAKPATARLRRTRFMPLEISSLIRLV